MMDFEKLLNGSRRYTLHSHTQFCDGRADMESFVKAAIAEGFTHYGFSPHSPVPFESPCNMAEADMPAYLAEFDRLKGIYGERIHLFKSLEVDFIDDAHNAASPKMQGLGLDYLISSVHFIHSQEGEIVDIDGKPGPFIEKMEQYFHNDIDYVVDTYFDQSHRMLDIGGFDIIGHYDKIGNNASHFKPGIEDSPRLRRQVDELTDHVIASGVAVEINTKAYEQFGRMYPGRHLWQRLVDAGVQILVNSDAHFTDKINASRDLAYDWLDQLKH